MKTVIVKWTGNFSYEQVCDSNKSNGIYLLTGRKAYERQNQIQYCGITEDYFCNRINNNHHKLAKIKTDTLSIWLGEIIYPTEFDRSLLELAEHCFVSFWQPPLNDRKTIYYPRDSVCFISEWFNQGEQARLNRPSIIKDLPDVLWWDEERWRTARLKVSNTE
ncbi:MAG: hypothetical protein H0U87_01365 [Acidobacteria bacterium]|jgi:hypothetical protein|nr:hypothetical protein [Acidobacteriota bacterium]